MHVFIHTYKYIYIYIHIYICFVCFSFCNSHIGHRDGCSCNSSHCLIIGLSKQLPSVCVGETGVVIIVVGEVVVCPLGQGIKPGDLPELHQQLLGPNASTGPTKDK